MRRVGSLPGAHGIHGQASNLVVFIIVCVLLCGSCYFYICSSKYPVENHYDSFVSSHGGSCNAFTEGEYTGYEFDVASEYFSEALDIFANCFKSPLFSMNAADREVVSIDNECNLARADDSARLLQLFCSSAKEGHLIRQFSWGNLTSLKELPASRGINIEKVLHDFREKYYTPRNAKLVVVCPKLLDEIQSDVMNCFADWNESSVSFNDADDEGNPAKRNRTTSSTEEATATSTSASSAEGLVTVELPDMTMRMQPFVGINPWPETRHNQLYRIVPIKSTHQLILTWPLCPRVQEYRKKTDHYLSHLIGHEGPGSLLTHLKSIQLATGVSGGVSLFYCWTFLYEFSNVLPLSRSDSYFIIVLQRVS